jgi:outer membrane translocation and assembly module TamA
MYLIKSELRFPFSGAIGGAVFYDGGAVYIDKVGFDDPYRDAAGLALRYETPVGSVSLEFGYKLDRKSDDAPGKRREDPWAIHFSIGTF